MAGLISTGIAGFIASAKFTGKQIANKAGKLIPEVIEDFMSGFAGHGWKIWKTVAGFFRLEIDELVVRRTLTVFELLIQKIRAVKGAYAITQANGKVKTVELSEDETTYLLTLEEDDMSFVEYDFIRCQEFDAGQKFYHVEIESVSEGVIRVPASEFTSSLPLPGDEIVQFGNSSHDEKYAGRHSAIYMHADESGQPAIDVMFDIYSKDWTNCVKVRVGGDIPGSGGLKGFYCENGMIKCVDTTGHTTYCLHPDGTAELGDGAAIFRPDKSGHIADGAIKWEWSKDQKKYVCTMGDVLLTWDNLSDETKENLKGEPGSIEELPDWLKGWNGYATELGEEYIVTPKMFSGTKSADGKLTGIAQGKDCITIDGKKRTGIFALVDNEVVFELDPLNKKYLFKGSISTVPIHVNKDNILQYVTLVEFETSTQVYIDIGKTGLNIQLDSDLSLNNTQLWFSLPRETKHEGSQVSICVAVQTHTEPEISDIYKFDIKGGWKRAHIGVRLFKVYTLKCIVFMPNEDYPYDLIDGKAIEWILLGEPASV